MLKQGVCMSTSTVVMAECERITQINRHNSEYYIVAPREIYDTIRYDRRD